MPKILLFISFSVLFIGMFPSCVSKKRKKETSAVGKFYHNTTAYYNGYWNAKEIMRETMISLRAANVDDYNKILEIEDFISVNDPKMVKPDMDKIIDKVTTAAKLHEPSDWVDNCYVLMAKAQYVKQEYETAEETLQYFQEDFNPSNPYGRNYKSKKLTGKAAKKKREADRKEAEEAREKEKEEKAAIKKQRAEDRADAKKAREKERADAKKAKAKERKSKSKSKSKSSNSKSKATKTSDKTVPDDKTQSEQPEAEIKETTEIKPITKPITKVDTKADEEKEVEDIVEDTPQKPKEPEEDKTAYSEGILWLAKTYIKRQNWYPAELLLKKLEKSPVNPDIAAEIPSTFANLYIKQGRYPEAIEKLITAIDLENSKQLKARYSFILGQLYQKDNDSAKAMNAFSDANKYAKDPKMEFMSELAIAKNSLYTGTKTKDEVIKSMLKLLKEDKYKDVNDQIYYTLAEIELSQNNTPEAIEYFRKATYAVSNDQKLKTEAYYNIGNLYYKNQDYLSASNYFDTTLVSMSKSDDRYTKVKNFSENLKDIAQNLSIIQTSDTLIYFADLDESERKKQIMKYLERNQAKVASTSAPTISKDLVVASKVDFGKSSFFAYNKTVKENGKDDFKKLWGAVANEDNWRRSSRSNASLASGDNSNSKVNESSGTVDEPNKEAYEKFIRDLPTNPVRRQELNDRIMSSMFTLGKLFRDKIENYSASAKTLTEMHTRYGPTQYELESYFYLYLDYMDLNDLSKADEYKSTIIRKYPDSKYAAILRDPDYFKKASLAQNRPEEYYKALYALFEKGEYDRVVNGIDNPTFSTDLPNPYTAKMALLKAMAVGGKSGKDAYVSELTKVISAFPNTPEQLKAKEIMRFLGGDNSAFNTINIQDVDKIFEREDDLLHYVAVVTYGLSDKDQIDIKIAISDYNKDNFKLERLDISDSVLSIDDNTQVILVRKFPDADKAMKYYDKVMDNKEEYLGKSGLNIDILPISQRNFRKMTSQRSASQYILFFDKNYLYR